MDKVDHRILSLYRIFTDNVHSRYGYQNNYLLTDIFKILYPEKSYTASDIRGFWADYVRRKSENRIINFYVHIPYCLNKCSYCICSSSPLARSRELSDYLNNLIKSFRYFKKTFTETTFNNLYIGGGTPSLMTEKQLSFLLHSLFRDFQFCRNGEKTMELNPVSANFKKMDILKKFGFNRVSFGVQSLDPAILAANNRGYQVYRDVRNAILSAKKADFKHINADLILGLFKETKKKFVASFEGLAALKPSSICIYPLQPKTDYIAKYFKSNIDLFNEYYENLVREIIPDIKILAKKYAYSFPEISLKNIRTASPWFLISKEADLLPSRYSFDNKGKTSIFALGFEGNSYIYNKIRYHHLPFMKDPAKNISEGVVFNKRMEMIHYILRVFSYDKWISRKDFKTEFLVEITKEFKDVFKRLGQKLFVSAKDPDKVYFTPSQPRERFLSSLFFFDKELIVRRMNEFAQDNLICLGVNDKKFLYRIGYSKNQDDLYSLELVKGVRRSGRSTRAVLYFLNHIFLQMCIRYRGVSVETVREILHKYMLDNAGNIKNRIGVQKIEISKV